MPPCNLRAATFSLENTSSDNENCKEQKIERAAVRQQERRNDKTCALANASANDEYPRHAADYRRQRRKRARIVQEITRNRRKRNQPRRHRKNGEQPLLTRI